MNKRPNVKMMRFTILLLVMALAALLGTGCSTAGSAEPVPEPDQQGQPPEPAPEVVEEPEEEIDPIEAIDLGLMPNEAGQVMVLMYHNIGESEAEWVRTPENFRRDLETLYEKGYRPLALRDFVAGNMTTEAGYTPVVITFDDANLNNFNVLEDGSIDPNCAFAILKEFGREHPDFPLAITFFADGSNPFRQPDLLEWKIEQILEAGMDIGNHTEGHQNLRNATASEIQRYIGVQAQFLESLTGDPDYRVDTLSLPYGGRPSDETLLPYLAEGDHQGLTYENVAILNVGWHPAHSPYDDRFDPLSLPRVRASEMKVDNVGMYNYLESFDNSPGQRFISDGNPDVITLPEELSERLDGYDGDRLINLYDPEEVQQ